MNLEDRKNPILLLFWLSAFGSLMVSGAFTLAHHHSLPPSDLAYGEPAFGSPLVGPVMFMGAAAATLFVFPLSLRIMRRVDLRLAYWLVLGCALAGAGGVTLLLGKLLPPLSILGLPASIAFTIMGMRYCRDRFPLEAPDPIPHQSTDSR